MKRIGTMRHGTAHRDNLCSRIFADEFSDDFPALCLTFGGNGASIDDDQIGCAPLFGFGVTVSQESGSDKFRLVLINLATECEKAKKHEVKNGWKLNKLPNVTPECLSACIATKPPGRVRIAVPPLPFSAVRVDGRRENLHAVHS